MQQAFSEFNRRYFHWAIGATLREVEQGCPRLELMHTGSSLRYLKYLRALPAEKRQTFVMALLKERIFKESLTSGIDGETLDAHEHALCNLYFDHPRPRDPEELRLEQLGEESPQVFKLSRRAFDRVLKEGFRSHGYQMKEEAGEPWYHQEMEVDPWTVSTNIVYGGRSSQISYFHRIVGPNRYQLKGALSITSWMGISGGAAIWRYCTPEEMEVAVKHLVSASVEFLRAVPELLHDLPIQGT